MKLTLSNVNDVFKSEICAVETMELKGYKLIENLFCDGSGLGADDEPALTQKQLIRELEGILKDYGQIYTTITNKGQFQLYVGVFIKDGKSKVKRIKSNTYEIIENGKRIIRLYDTNILEFEGDKVRISNGGSFTKTTAKRINEFLPYDVFVYQKNYDWFIDNKGKKIEFKEGVEISL